MFHSLHTADTHLDYSFRGIEAHADARVEEICGATRRASAHCIDLAIDESVEITNTTPLLYNLTIVKPHSQVQQQLRAQLLRHGERQ